MSCYCGKSLSFEECCDPYILGLKYPSLAIDLMRSRYSAFATCNMNYLFKTQDPMTAYLFDIKSNEEWARSVVFTRLEIIKYEEDGAKAIIEFKANFIQKSTGKNLVHHEISLFKQDHGQWYYVMQK